MNHDYWMQKALEQARFAEIKGEVPVGAVLVINDELIASGHNQNISLNDPSAHAEIGVLRAAGKKILNYRLLNASLYVTLEPCLMCVGVMVHARVAKVIFGARDSKTGACGSCIAAHELEFHNHHLQVVPGVLEDECSALLRAFFKARR